MSVEWAFGARKQCSGGPRRRGLLLRVNSQQQSPAWFVVRLALLLAVGVLTSCRDARPPSTKDPIRIVVTVAPLAGLAKPFVPEGGELRTLMAPGRSEHGYEFTPDDLAALGRADVVVLVGLGLEPKVEQFLREHPSATRQIVNFGQVVGIQVPQDADHEPHASDAAASEPGHVHDEHCDHGHGPDPHLWLDPILVTQLVPAIRSAVQTVESARGAAKPERLAEVEAKVLADVLAVDDEYRSALATHKGKEIVTHHSAWGRLADRYGLSVAQVLRPVEAIEPDPSHTAAVVEAIKIRRVAAVFIEPQYDAGAAKRIADAAGVKVLTLDPIGTGDWAGMMRSNLAALRSAFEGR